MVSGISGSNLATSLRELDRVSPPTQNEALIQSSQKAGHSILVAKTDTVTISKEALAMSKAAEQTNREPSETSEKDRKRPLR